MSGKDHYQIEVTRIPPGTGGFGPVAECPQPLLMPSQRYHARPNPIRERGLSNAPLQIDV